jgi:hypothetical protein
MAKNKPWVTHTPKDPNDTMEKYRRTCRVVRQTRIFHLVSWAKIKATLFAQATKVGLTANEIGLFSCTHCGSQSCKHEAKIKYFQKRWVLLLRDRVAMDDHYDEARRILKIRFNNLNEAAHAA